MSDVSEHSDSEFYFPKKKKKKKKGKALGHMIKCLLTELGRAGPDRKILGPRSWCTDLAALGPYAMTSGQKFSRPALLLSQ